MEDINEFKENLEDPRHIAELLFNDNVELSNRALDLLNGFEDYSELKRDIAQIEDLISLENFGDTVVKLIQRVIEHIKKIIQKIIDSGPVLTAAATYVNFRAENIKVESRGLARKNTSRKFVVTSRIQNLCTRYNPITNAPNLLANLRQLDLIVSSYVNGLNTVIIKPAANVPSYINTAINANELASLMLAASPTHLAVPELYSATKGRFESMHLMGNHQIVINVNKTGSDDPYEQVKDISVRLVPFEDNPRPLPTSIEFERFNLQSQDSIIKRVLNIVNNIQTANGDNVRLNRTTRIRSLKESLERLERELATTNDAAVRENARKLIVLVETYIDWLAVPYLDLFALTMRNLTATLNVCEANLK